MTVCDHEAGFGESARSRIAMVVDDPEARDRLVEYFGSGTGADDVAWTGGWFERLGGGGDRADIANRFTAEDAVAVTMLGVDVPARVAVGLLEGPLGAALGELLERIPAGARIETATREDLAPGSPADQAWHLLEGQTDVGWVRAGKMLARKRPHLVPVYDEVVRCWLRTPAPGTFWESMRCELQRDDHRLTRKLEDLRRQARLPANVSAARVLDVLMWRQHEGDHRRGHCA